MVSISSTGRPFELKGRYFANIFIHFMPTPSRQQLEESALPPYILPNSKAAEAWEDGLYDGEIPGAPKKKKWGKLSAHDAAGDGDLDTLIEIAKEEVDILHSTDKNGWTPIHEAVRSGHYNVIEFLHQQNADFNAKTDFGEGDSVLDIALDRWGDDETFINWIRNLGATVTQYDLGPEL